MIYPPPFPTSVDQLTTSTLSDAIGKEIETFQATQIGEDRGMLGEIFRLDLSFHDKGETPISIVAKFAAMRDFSLDQAKRGGIHERELRCYDELLAATPIDAPKMFAAWYNPETAEFLLLQEMVESDTSVNQITGISQTQSRLVITEMAKLHAFWWGKPILETLSWLPRLDDQRRRTNLTMIAREGWGKLRMLLDEDVKATIEFNGDQLAEKIDDMLCRTATFPSTLVHSDLRSDNLLFSLDGSSVTLIDWQGCSIAPPVFDLAYFLCQSLTINDRQLFEEELLLFYKQELHRNGLQISLENLREVYESSLFYSLAVACSIPLVNDISKPRVHSLGVSMATRSIEALQDHNQI
ncbi:MAG: phosphotransferase [Acidimicrobiales bacterium]|nr:phosphotransferase [Acidimicrobiales bacterium]